MIRIGYILGFILFINNTVDAQVGSLENVIIDQIVYVGNEKTKIFVLERELTFVVGDTILSEELSAKIFRSQENLFNTSLFNKVEHEVSYIDSNHVKVIFILEERWYVWPLPILENGDRNFNTWWKTKDFERLTYGIFLNWNNFRGRNETFQVLAKVGFENQFSIGYNIPNLNKKKTLELYLATGYAGYREVNYTSEENKRVFYKSEEGPGKQVLFGRVNLTYRKSLNSRHRIGLSYHHVSIDSVLTDLTNNYLNGNQKKSEYFTLSYYGKYDTRDYVEYPLKGYKVEAYINKYGLGLMDNSGLNVLICSGGVFLHVPLGGRWYFANSVVGKISLLDSTPYSIQEGLGYKNYVRGYELYVMDAEDYGVIKTNLKFNILKKKEMHLKWLALKKFNKPYFALYLNAYFDVGYAEDVLYNSVNSLSNKWIFGSGVGLDVTAFYDFVMRLEYSFNRENESGFFLHFKKSI
jgi:hypothetical protein